MVAEDGLGGNGIGRRLLIYVAGPLNAKPDVRSLASHLRDFNGSNVVSRWHDLPDSVTEADPVDEVERQRINDMNMADLDRADVVVAWTLTGQPSATYCEIGYAAGKGKVVIWVQGPNNAGANIFDAHAFVIVLTHFQNRVDGSGKSIPITSTLDAAVCANNTIHALTTIKSHRSANTVTTTAADVDALLAEADAKWARSFTGGEPPLYARLSSALRDHNDRLVAIGRVLNNPRSEVSR